METFCNIPGLIHDIVKSFGVYVCFVFKRIHLEGAMSESLKKVFRSNNKSKPLTGLIFVMFLFRKTRIRIEKGVGSKWWESDKI